MKLETPGWPFGRQQNGGLPRWRRERGLSRIPRRWGWAEEWWEVPEPFEGAAALSDLALTDGDPECVNRVVARFVVLRFVIQTVEHPPPAGLLKTERAAARGYVGGAWPSGRSGRQALERALREAARPQEPTLCRALCTAGADAAREGHRGGASALYQTGYRLALAAGCLAEAAAAASAIAALVASGEGRRSARLWRRRARVLARAAAGRRRPAEAARH